MLYLPKPCLDWASVQLLGTPASDTNWRHWHHSTQDARQDGYVLSWGWMWQRGLKSKHKLIYAVSTVGIALKVDSSAVWHQIGMFTINLWSNTSKYVLIQTNTNHNTHNNISSTTTSRLGSTCIVFEYVPNTYLLHTNTYQNTCWYLYVCWAKTSVLNQNSIHAITYQIHTNTYQYIPWYMPDTYQYKICSAHGFSPSIQVLACILVCIACIEQVFGMYYVMIPVNTSKYINTYQYVQYIQFFLYIPILGWWLK